MPLGHSLRMRGLAAAAMTAFAAAGLQPALAHEHTAGDLVIDHPYARATPPNAPVAGGYMTIRNTGEAVDRLLGGTVGFADRVEIHEMTMDGDVMKMRPLPDGLEIPAGGEVQLRPGGYHLMFIGLEERLLEGESRPATLTFERAGEVAVEFTVEAIGAGGHGTADHGAGGHAMDGHGTDGGSAADAGHSASPLSASPPSEATD